MNHINFVIGLTLMNAMPHFVLGTWNGRMLSGLSFGNLQNILYGLINFVIPIGLFIYSYGSGKILENVIYSGAVAVFLIFLLLDDFGTPYLIKNSFELN